ncbi:transcriptional regulator Myc-2-like isoform X2 [Anthonomus grandis grandis]|uniref:transcriptional regulator Myc-2-like isoform X2 n=1 Tax=Anthonomus grandis grandis TaxID=2921223 RepID=UPI002166299A|nr:transcriptional regulator Myc-2-like isoform X2 [Anthonomus grandis grandis]
MIDKMNDSIFESMLPLTVEQLSSAPLLNVFLNDDDDDADKSPKDYLMPSDDQWKKFELDFPELANINIDDIFNGKPSKNFDSGVNDSSWELPSMIEDNSDCLVFNHDCMWGGFCASKDHNAAPRPGLRSIVPKPPVIKMEPVDMPRTFNGQQSLLKPSIKVASMPTSLLAPTSSGSVSESLLTPPESDDEGQKTKTNGLLKLLNDAINECDLAEYLGKEEIIGVKPEPSMEIKEEVLDIKQEEEPADEDTESEQDEIEYRIRTQLAAENDHSYYKDKNADMRHNDYGLDTPSDSEEEEEIDVVSVNDKFTNASRIALSLQSNSSTRHRPQVQRVAPVMTKKRGQNTGIKTILPVRSIEVPTTSSNTNTGRRGVKRGKGSRNNNNYKRRRANNTVEEREPTDKRHLHNDMERQRRVDLRIAFDNLKSVVPEVSGTKKIAKVTILLQASQYCYYLTGMNNNYMKQLEELRRKQAWLRSRVSQLRRNLAAKR